MHNNLLPRDIWVLWSVLTSTKIFFLDIVTYGHIIMSLRARERESERGQTASLMIIPFLHPEDGDFPQFMFLIQLGL